MKLIKVEMYDSLKTADIIEDHWDEKNGWSILESNPICFVCGDTMSFGVLLKDIDDGCMDDSICAKCIDELKIRLDILRTSFQR